MGNLDVPSRMDNRPRIDCECSDLKYANPLLGETCVPVPQKPSMTAGLVHLHLSAQDIGNRLDEIEVWLTGDKPKQERGVPGDSNIDDQITSITIRLDEAKQSLERIRMAIVGNEHGDRIY